MIQKQLRLYLMIVVLALTPKVYAEAIATAHPLATQAGVEVFDQGGNAFDAAVAITAALAVAEPYSSGLGGGGFYLLYISSENRYVFLDAREKAPLKAHRDMYLDSDKNVIPNLSIDGPLSAGIPGIPAALEHLSTRYGKQSMAQNLQSAIAIAENGFRVDGVYHRLAKWRLPVLQKYPNSAKAFLIQNELPKIGDLIVQPDLAKTLKQMADKGADGFYKGAVADAMIQAVQQNGGIWQHQDLLDYEVVEREPIDIKFKNARLISAPPPSSGGIAIAQILNQLEQMTHSSNPALKPDVKQTHALIESMRRAYRDRAIYLGDSDFVDIPIEQLISKTYAAGLVASIHPEKASKSAWFSANIDPRGGNHTTHFSITDKHGNSVAATLSVNYPFGSCFVAGNTGILLNDEMDDFVAKAGEPNVYGLVGGTANAIKPGKRMLSSMSPTILEQPDRTVILGTPGGSRIITMVLQGLLTAMDGGSAVEIVNRRRLHHQFLPDMVALEPNTLSEETIKDLQAMGHNIKQQDRTWGNMQAIVHYKDGTVEAASDSRGIGTSWVRRKSE